MFSFVRERSITNQTVRARNVPAHAAPSTGAASRFPMRMTASPAPMKSPPATSPSEVRSDERSAASHPRCVCPHAAVAAAASATPTRPHPVRAAECTRRNRGFESFHYPTR